MTRDGVQVRVQLLSTEEHRELAAWPTEVRTVMMRYSDVSEADLRVPTLTSFAVPRRGTCTTWPRWLVSARLPATPPLVSVK